MRLFVTRHGETDGNSRNLICGVSEVDLSPSGISQAKALAERLKQTQDMNMIRHIIVSPQKRARDTAAPIEEALGVNAIIAEELREVDFGIYEGTDRLDPVFQAAKCEPFKRFPDGESILFAAQRAYNLIDRIKDTYNENTLLVCHGTIMRIIDTYFNDYTIDEYRNLRPGNCELRVYDLDV